MSSRYHSVNICGGEKDTSSFNSENSLPSVESWMTASQKEETEQVILRIKANERARRTGQTANDERIARDQTLSTKQVTNKKTDISVIKQAPQEHITTLSVAERRLLTATIVSGMQNLSFYYSEDLSDRTKQARKVAVVALAIADEIIRLVPTPVFPEEK